MSDANTEVRELRVNSPNQRVRFVTNHISTAKYNPISFLPKFLFEQFRRYANIFFLCIGLLQQVSAIIPSLLYIFVIGCFSPFDSPYKDFD